MRNNFRSGVILKLKEVKVKRPSSKKNSFMRIKEKKSFMLCKKLISARDTGAWVQTWSDFITDEKKEKALI